MGLESIRAERIKMFKYELHLHSCQGSKCGVSEGKDYVDFYIKNGYSGAILTDHFYHGNTRPDRSLPWAQYMDEYLSGYYDMKKAAEGKDFEVFFGVEELFDTWDEYLVYGLEPEWYISHPELRDMKRVEFLTLAKESGAFIIQAHPYRYRDYFKCDHLTISSSLVDGYEVFNSCNTPEHNKLALMLAEKENKIMVGGSDRHKAADYIETLGGIILQEKVHSIGELIDAVRAGKSTVMGVETLDSVSENIEPDLPVTFI